MKIQLEFNRSDIIQCTVALLVERINTHSGSNPFILCLSTGATVLSICQELSLYVKDGRCSLKNVVVFYAGGYVGFSKSRKEQYFHRLFDEFFSHVDIDEKNIYIPDGYAENLVLECQKYEDKIRDFGGIDFFLGSLGETGNLAFNEPGSALRSRTRIKTLTEETIKADARFFGNDMSLVPSQAITIGMQTIFDSKEIVIAVYGIQKAFALKLCLESSISEMNPASILQLHNNTTFIIDQVAGRLLHRVLCGSLS